MVSPTRKTLWDNVFTDRRRELASVLERRKPFIEDDAYGELNFLENPDVYAAYLSMIITDHFESWRRMRRGGLWHL
jgi:hypothetical protein